MLQSSRRFSLLQVALFGGAFATATTLSLWGPAWCRSVRAVLQDSPKTVVDEFGNSLTAVC